MQMIRCIVGLLVGFLFITIGCVAVEKHADPSGPQSVGESSSGRTPRPERSGLAVFKFENTTVNERSGHFQPWEYGIAAMLTTDLEATAMFNIVDRVRLNQIIREQDLQLSGLVDPTTAVTAGKLIAAEYILTGAFMVVGEDLKITAQVFSVERGIQLGAISVAGKTENFFLVQKDLFAKVTQTLRVMLDEEKQAGIMRAIETKSMEASLKNYSGEIAMLKAEEMKQLGNKKDSKIYRNAAKRKFKEALAYDPNYERARRNLARLVMAIPMTL